MRLGTPVFVVLTAVVVGAGILALLRAAPDDPQVRAQLSFFPPFHAALNATAALLLTTGYLFIRARKRTAHVTCMIAALATTGIFLVSYLYYHSRAGSVGFQAEGPIRIVYFAILGTHTVLAAFVAPLAAVVIRYAVQGRLDRHRAVARWTLPLWLYVSVTGVLIYLMLYVWFPH